MQLKLGAEPHTIDFSFEIAADVKEVGVLYSGGLDSSALLGLILTELRDTNRLRSVPVTLFTAIKMDGSTYYAQRMARLMVEHFGIAVRHNNNQINTEMEVGRVSISVHEALHAANPDMLLFQGVNRMVGPEVREFKHQLKVHYGDKYSNSDWLRSPFLTMMKPQMLDVYYQLGLNMLIPYTHTCTVVPDGRCNDCYSCEERAWAFQVLGRRDPTPIGPDVADLSFGGSWMTPRYY